MRHFAPDRTTRGKKMARNAFARLEESAWGSAGVAAAYERGFARVTTCAIAPLLRAVAMSPSERRDASLLDVACGLGALARAAAASGRYARVVGADFSEAMIVRATTHSAGSTESTPLHFVHADAARLPFEAHAFDAVTCAFGVLHMPEPRAFFAEAARVLRPGGRFAFAVWCPPPATEGYEIMLGATAQHAVDLPEGPPMFEFADGPSVCGALGAVGFEGVRSIAHDMVWELDSAADFWSAVKDGTARTRAHIAALTDAQRREVKEAVLRACATRVSADGRLRLQMPCVISSATRASRE